MIRSRASTSLELSEFFNDDDSDGHRLAEFLLRKKGETKRPQFLFMSSQPQRTSLNVQLEKVQPTPPAEKENKENNRNINESNKTDKENEKSQQNIINDAAKESGGSNKASSPVSLNVFDVTSIPETQQQLPNNNNNNTVLEIPETQAMPLPRSAEAKANALCASSQLPATSPIRPLSPRISAVRKSGGVSPSDRLRRLSLKRLTKIGNGRRTLLQEFENTVGENDFVSFIVILDYQFCFRI